MLPCEPLREDDIDLSDFIVPFERELIESEVAPPAVPVLGAPRLMAPELEL